MCCGLPRVQQPGVGCNGSTLCARLVKYIYERNDAFFDFVACYCKLLQFITLCNYHWVIASRILRKENLINWFMIPMAFFTALYFLFVIVLGILTAHNSWDECIRLLCPSQPHRMCMGCFVHHSPTACVRAALSITAPPHVYGLLCPSQPHRMCMGCFVHHSPTTCVRNQLLFWISLLTLLLCVARLVRFYQHYFSQWFPYSIIVLAAVECLTFWKHLDFSPTGGLNQDISSIFCTAYLEVLVKYIYERNDAFFDFVACYCKLLQFITLCNYHWVIASRILRKENLINCNSLVKGHLSLKGILVLQLVVLYREVLLYQSNVHVVQAMIIMDYFIGKRNVIYERAKFNRRSQGETEPVEEFITNLYVLAETCSYGSLKEEMIRDRLVVGVKNFNLSEKLQLESELTLEKAIQIVRQSESVKNQQKEIRQDTEKRNVDVIDRKGGRNGTNFQNTRMKGTKTYNSNFPKNPQGWSSNEKRKCLRCGYYQGHSKEQCPAKDAICNKCRKKGHFAKVCHTKTVQEVLSSLNDAFIGIVGMQENAEDKWCEVIKVNDQPIKFKIDTGAEVSVMPEGTYLQHFGYLKTEKADKNIFAVSEKIEVNGMFQAFLESKRQKCEETIYIEPKGDGLKDSDAKPKGAGVRELPPLEVNDRVWLTDLNGEPYVNYPEANPHTSDAATDVTDSSTSPGRTVRPPRRFGED
ncbi:hypothetical protein LAZ67_5001667 [Cordylochernes scorpioides]|uniref:CCHC-type domain-containing protein n=1 Tax=Cordylochernes scorpioides TaxID=51811 RepID=A0ABY6KIW9_9ARAC|nr:hypothetical protein LAZ67_5001667 [Cordylochernes scorpioides]